MSRFACIFGLVLLAWAAAAQAALTEFARDDFSSDSGQFFQGKVGASQFSYKPEGGYYEIDATASDTGALTALTEEFSDYEAAVDLQFVGIAGGKDPYAGLVFHYSEEDGASSFYLFAVFPDGYYAVWQVNRESERTYAYKLTHSPLVNPAGPNSLKVRARANRFEFYLNGRMAGEFSTRTEGVGGVGLFASAGTRVHFRNFVWRVEEEEYHSRMLEGGAFGFVRRQNLPAAFSDDFSRRLWPQGESAGAKFSYTGNGYRIDNTKGNTMAVSYRTQPEVSSGLAALVVSSAAGEAGNGFGMAFSFQLREGYPSYYALIIARDGTYKVFRNEGSTATTLLDWQDIPFEVDFAQPVMLGAAFVRTDDGLRIYPGVNGRALTGCVDGNPLPPGGFAMIVAPLVTVVADRVMLYSFDGMEKTVLGELRGSGEE
jgi:hypothetical protein